MNCASISNSWAYSLASLSSAAFSSMSIMRLSSGSNFKTESSGIDAIPVSSSLGFSSTISSMGGASLSVIALPPSARRCRTSAL